MITTPRSIALQIHLKAESKEYPIVGIEKFPPGLQIRIGFQNYVLVLQTNRLVRIDGNRIKRTYPHRAVDIEYARRTYEEILLEESSSCLTKG